MKQRSFLRLFWVLALLGARTLEGLNLRVDPKNKKLVAGGPLLAG